MTLETLDLATLWPLALKMMVSAGGAVLVLIVFVIAASIVKSIVRRLVSRGRAHRRDLVNVLGTAARWFAALAFVGLALRLMLSGRDGHALARRALAG